MISVEVNTRPYTAHDCNGLIAEKPDAPERQGPVQSDGSAATNDVIARLKNFASTTADTSALTLAQ